MVEGGPDVLHGPSFVPAVLLAGVLELLMRRVQKRDASLVGNDRCSGGRTDARHRLRCCRVRTDARRRWRPAYRTGARRRRSPVGRTGAGRRFADLLRFRRCL